MKRKHVSPSRVRYETRKPTLSFRLTREELEEVREMQRQAGLKLNDLMMRGAHLEEKVKESYLQGFQRGVHNTMGRFPIPCTGCGEPILLDMKSASVRESVLKTFARFRHSGCAGKEQTAPPPILVKANVAAGNTNDRTGGGIVAPSKITVLSPQLPLENGGDSASSSASERPDTLTPSASSPSSLEGPWWASSFVVGILKGAIEEVVRGLHER
jgi:hypothetical protein